MLSNIDLGPVYEWVSKSERRSAKVEFNWNRLPRLSSIPVNSESNRSPSIEVFVWENGPAYDFHNIGVGTHIKLPITADEIDLALKTKREKAELEQYEKLRAKFETRADKEKAPAIEAEGK
ncbi:hypothetical protein [Desulfitobacterium hafniense]|uniref:hypothetical protein n=1 Tax=Desulfitobacterium hafniense TaxID=49338 RepID=UPI001FA7483E|nr:hypothetical protein [Desulfitobacterium hafniense]